MRSIQVSEIKLQLSDILDAVEMGETILINRNGRNIAKIIPENDDVKSASEILEAMKKIKELRKKMTHLTFEDIQTARLEGQR